MPARTILSWYAHLSRAFTPVTSQRMSQLNCLAPPIELELFVLLIVLTNSNPHQRTFTRPYLRCSVGTTIMLRKVEVTRPHRITIAMGQRASIGARLARICSPFGQHDIELRSALPSAVRR
jgi:hypothetical protein